MPQDISHMNIQVNTGDNNNNSAGSGQGGGQSPQSAARPRGAAPADETGAYMPPASSPSWAREVSYAPAAPEEMMVGGTVSYDPTLRSDYAQSQRMRNPVDMEATMNPSDSSESYRASLRSLLDRNIGFFVVATFLMGTTQSVTWQGILHTVGSDYFVLYQPDYDRYVSCDLYSVKFVQFHNVKGVPYCASARTWEGNSSW